MDAHREARPPSTVDDPWGEWSYDDERPDAFEGESTRATTPPVDDGAIQERNDARNLDAE
jgi:hypothetical protein